ncbi:hypothetical protein VTI74DRAFT_1791 [Chaetomium olivicolor]
MRSNIRLPTSHLLGLLPVWPCWPTYTLTLGPRTTSQTSGEGCKVEEIQGTSKRILSLTDSHLPSWSGMPVFRQPESSCDALSLDRCRPVYGLLSEKEQAIKGSQAPAGRSIHKPSNPLPVVGKPPLRLCTTASQKAASSLPFTSCSSPTIRLPLQTHV